MFCLGPSGVGVNELRRQLIELNPNRFQSAVPRTFTLSFIAVHTGVRFSFYRCKKIFRCTDLNYVIPSLL